MQLFYYNRATVFTHTRLNAIIQSVGNLKKYQFSHRAGNLSRRGGKYASLSLFFVQKIKMLHRAEFSSFIFTAFKVDKMTNDSPDKMEFK